MTDDPTRSANDPLKGSSRHHAAGPFRVVVYTDTAHRSFVPLITVGPIEDRDAARLLDGDVKAIIDARGGWPAHRLGCRWEPWQQSAEDGCDLPGTTTAAGVVMAAANGRGRLVHGAPAQDSSSGD